MMLRLLAIAVVAALIPAAALAQPVVQVVTAARVTAVADRLAATLITDPDKAITPALSISGSRRRMYFPSLTELFAGPHVSGRDLRAIDDDLMPVRVRIEFG